MIWSRCVIWKPDRSNISCRTARETVEPFAEELALTSAQSELSGREIKRMFETDAEYRAGLVSRGVPAPRADLLLGLFAASRKGEFAAVDPTLKRLLGRNPLSFRDVLAKGIAEGRKTFF
jgi:NAD(P)H dehydrogenase (quinone)